MSNFNEIRVDSLIGSNNVTDFIIAGAKHMVFIISSSNRSSFCWAMAG